MPPAAAYIRVSTKSQGTDLQHHAIRAAAAARGDDITLIYEERRSGKTTTRPELQRMLQDARAGRLPPRLYVFRYDRLSRGKIAELLGMVNELRQVGVQIVSVKDEVTLSGPIGEFVLAGMALAAAIELSAGEDRRAGARSERGTRPAVRSTAQGPGRGPDRYPARRRPDPTADRPSDRGQAGHGPPDPGTTGVCSHKYRASYGASSGDPAG